MEAYRHCLLCPRKCGVDRIAGERGVCGETAVCRVASAGPHFGEEPPFSGTRGSGTIFFSGCSCRCFFCQNFQISTGGEGREVTPEQLLEMTRGLVRQGVHNLNFVTPDHFWPHIASVCRVLRAEGATLPFLFNCSGYQDPARVDEYAELIDIFLPDFKFADAALAQEVMRDRRYPELALAALQKMVATRGFLPPFDPEGREPARRGVLVRHLVLPGHVENSLQTMELLRREFGPRLPLSVMSQFHPTPGCAGHEPFARRVTPEEYRRVTNKVEELGFENVFIQPDRGDPDFLPDFTGDQPFEGNRKKQGQTMRER